MVVAQWVLRLYPGVWFLEDGTLGGFEGCRATATEKKIKPKESETKGKITYQKGLVSLATHWDAT